MRAYDWEGYFVSFANERQLFSYTELTPTEHASDQSIRKGQISQQGNRHLRGILIDIAWRARHPDPEDG